ncbi:MAG: hypothetical protein WCH86_07690 [Kiritimatiellales bacterium]
MKLIKLIAVLCFCSSVVLAETTVEIVQQRAEAGDAAAQTLMGLMAFYGYQVPRDREASQAWYQRAADQGDSFAAGRIIVAKKQPEVSKTGLSKKPSSGVSSTKSLMFLPKEELEKKVADASSAEYKGNLVIEDLWLKRNEYIGKVVELRFKTCTLSTSAAHPYFSVHNDDHSGLREMLILCGQDALEWGLAQSKRGHGSSSKAYVLVEEKGLLALGTKQSQADNGYTYSW